MSAPEPRSSLPLRLLRAARNLPLLVTVGVHVALGLIAAVVIVQQTTAAKKRTFEAAPAIESATVKQVEHRLQVARRGGASAAAASPVSANRVFSTSAEALALPSLPDLPSMNGGSAGSVPPAQAWASAPARGCPLHSVAGSASAGAVSCP